MSALVLDAGAFVAVDKGDRSMMARLMAASRHGLDLKTHPLVVAEVWRDPQGRQARLAGLLKAVDVRDLDASLGRATGVLLGAARLSDPVDGALVLLAESGDRVVTSDPDDIVRLARAAGRALVVVET